MDNNTFLEKVNEVFSKFNVNNLIVEKDNAYSNFLVLTIDKEEDIPSYKIACGFLDEGYLNVYAQVKHNAKNKQQFEDLYDLVNQYNKRSFLKFIIDEEYVKIRYSIIELDFDDVIKVARILSVIPSEISDFYQKLIYI